MRTLFIIAAISAAAGTVSLEPNSTLVIDGTSTVRDYRCAAGTMESTITTQAGTSIDGLVEAARVTIPVAQLECGNGKMNDHMRKALQAKDHPNVIFELTSYTVNGADAVLVGELTIAGTTKPIEMPATIQDEDGALRVQASKQINMSEWGVKPPSLMLGTLKVRDAVTINFDVSLKP